jgi:N-acetyl-anhydromuramyl-L-alanine amidase AmpD
VYCPGAAMRALQAMAMLCVAGCSGVEPPQGPIARSLADAAAAARLPVDLVAAIAVEEGGLALPAYRTPHADDPVAVAGRLELRHGRIDTLAIGATLIGQSEPALEADTELATRAGAQVVAALGATAAPDTWPAALAALSGLSDDDAGAYAARVLATLHDGGAFTAHGDEVIAIAPHPDVAVPAVPARRTLAPLDTVEFPGATWYPTDCSGKCDTDRPLGNAAVDTIVIHDTEGDWDASVATLQYEAGVSVHYLVDADGSRVAQFLPETDTAWHAGNYFYNETSVGIEHVGHAADPAGYAAALYATSEALVVDIASRWAVPLDRTHIVGHYQVPDGDVISEDGAPCADTLASCEADPDYGGASNHRDPGSYWDWDGYLDGIAELALQTSPPVASGFEPATPPPPEAAPAGCNAGGPRQALGLALGLAFGLWLRRRWRRAGRA